MHIFAVNLTKTRIHYMEESHKSSKYMIYPYHQASCAFP